MYEKIRDEMKYNKHDKTGCEKVNCLCIGKRAKEHIKISNLQSDIKNSLLNARTCGELSEFDAAKY